MRKILNFQMTRNTERYFAIAGIFLGLAISYLLAPKDAYFLSNIVFYWGSQICVLICVWPFKPRAMIIAGISTALAIYLGTFGVWLFTRNHPESIAWLGYVFSLPGAWVGALIAIVFLHLQTKPRPIVAGIVAAGITLVGIAISQTIVCSTVMYCLGK